MFEKQMLQYFLNTLVTAAAQNADPTTYADLILDQAPAATVEKWIGAQNLFEELAKIDARIAQFPDWFNELHEQIIERRREEIGAGADPPPLV